MKSTRHFDTRKSSSQEDINHLLSEELMEDNEEWRQLQQDWQSYQPDIAKIKRKIAWVTWRMISVLVLDVLVMLSYIPFLIYWVFPTDAPLIYKLWSYVMLLFGVIGVYLDFRLRLPVLQLDKGSTKNILESYLKLVRAGVLIGLWGYRLILILLALFIGWVAAIYWLESENGILIKFGTILSILLVLTLSAVAMYWYKNKKSKEEQRLASLWKEYIS